MISVVNIQYNRRLLVPSVGSTTNLTGLAQQVSKTIQTKVLTKLLKNNLSLT